MIHWDIDADGIVTLTMDDPAQPVNTMNQRFKTALHDTVERLRAERDTVRGVIVASAKKSFFAGGDLPELFATTPEDADRFAAGADRLKADLRTLETLGVPVVAAINGAALGGGYEVALAAHHRILLDVPGAVVGQPEVTFGLLPGGGGVTRTVRMFGVERAVADILLPGTKFPPAQALALGLVDEVVGTPEELIARAKAWIAANPRARQPWDRAGYRIPGGAHADLTALPASLREQLKSDNFPAPQAILAAAEEGVRADFDTAGKIETRYLTSVVTGQVAKNMIQARFFDLNSITKGGSRPAGYPVTSFAKVAVLGAGMMGAGIAYVQARAGMQVVLKDTSLAAAEKGKAYSQKLLDKAVERGQLTAGERDEVLGRIVPTDSDADCGGCDLVVEAVFEDPSLKKRVFAEVEQAVLPDAMLASNTSTLPITDLATGVSRPEDFIGLHFFSPVDKMPLVEIIVGAKTSDATLAKAIDYTLAIGKTPIVVDDSRGFFTSRVIGTFVDEAMAMVGEGVEPSSIEQAGLRAGYPAPPLQLMDELTLALPLKVREITRAETEAAGGVFAENGAGPVMATMVYEFGRKGRSALGGFYDYADGKRTQLWPGLREAFNSGTTTLPSEDIQERMLFAEAVETVRCFDEGVLRTIPDANVGSLLGIGFPAWTGGVIQYIRGYPGGVPGFVARAHQLAERYGPRFTPPASLAGIVARGKGA
jgi:3-hydroxyacyl-CoA dehydrogenase/enoyl-CoA hydratase/3-hydroxybutyryl-CoA epimerase